MEPSESPPPRAGELIPLLRKNLDRDWGCKVFFVGASVLGIRLPRERAGMMTDEDAARVRSVLEIRAHPSGWRRSPPSSSSATRLSSR
jgi:hypothetical protein